MREYRMYKCTAALTGLVVALAILFASTSTTRAGPVVPFTAAHSEQGSDVQTVRIVCPYCTKGHVCRNGKCVPRNPTCKPCTILCMKGFVCRCGKCVRTDPVCKHRPRLCKPGYIWKCNRCVRRHK
jgi:hypothetical protein